MMTVVAMFVCLAAGVIIGMTYVEDRPKRTTNYCPEHGVWWRGSGSCPAGVDPTRDRVGS